MSAVAAFRLRGDVPARQSIRDTLRLLRLTKVNTCAVFTETPSVIGMLRKANWFIAWGPVTDETAAQLKDKAHFSSPSLKSKRLPYPRGDLGYRKEMDTFFQNILGKKAVATKTTPKKEKE